MCGLAGVFGNLCLPDQSVFKQLLILASLRGPHSTGVAKLDGKGIPDNFKLAVNPYEYLNYEDDKKNTSAKWLDADWHNNQAVMGHGRWATVGNIVDENAHPFVHGHITLMHNGGLQNYRALQEDNKFEVDSESAAYYLAKYGINALIDKARGDYAFTWIDANEKSFNFIRNESRPLWIAEHTHRHTWYYSSEAEMLKFVLDRAKVPHKPVWQPAPGQHVKFSREKPTVLTFDKIELPKTYFTGPVHNDYSAGGGTRPFRRNPKWQLDVEDSESTAYYEGWWKDQPLSAPVKESTKEAEKTTGASSEKSAVKTESEISRTNARSTLRASVVRNFGIGHEFNEHMKYKKGGVLVGFFDKYVPAYSGRLNHEYPVRGTLSGSFDDSSSLNCRIEVQCDDVRRFVSRTDDSMKTDWLSFTYTNLYWDPIREEWVVQGVAPALANYNASSWATLREPNDIELTEWFLKPDLPAGMISKMSLPFKDDPIEVVGQSTDDAPVHTFRGYNGAMLTQEQWDQSTKLGCSLCSDNLDSKHSHKIGWVDKDSPLCPDCSVRWTQGGALNIHAINSLH